MRYFKKQKYKLDKERIFVKEEKDLTVQELYAQRLREKKRFTKRH